MQRLTLLEPGRWPTGVQPRPLGAQERRDSVGGLALHESGGLGVPVSRERERRPFKGDIAKWGVCRGADRMRESDHHGDGK